MPQSLLKTREEFRWLRDVHLPALVVTQYKRAILHGNEDWPDKIELFAQDHYQCIPDVFVPDADGRFVAVPVQPTTPT